MSICRLDSMISESGKNNQKLDGANVEFSKIAGKLCSDVRIDVDAIERCTLDPCKKLSLHNVVLYHEVLRYEVRNWLSSASEI